MYKGVQSPKYAEELVGFKIASSLVDRVPPSSFTSFLLLGKSVCAGPICLTRLVAFT
jgi:hypothetical protein